MANRLSDVKVTTGRGTTVKVKDLGKKAPTAKPKPVKTPTTTKMTPQDAAMLKILQKKYGSKVYKG